ncbi:hypothetical protein [Psychromonas arctica]|uniref:hypothetical protein n=1 Tax=Psychromonas arctica TaxID=168275 RepID=UPI00048EFD76|nr:hypothetical protein [Psychromonas arctica]
MALGLLTTLPISRRHHVVLFVLTVLILGLGYYFSLIQLLDTEWFSRSGSVVVVLGIISGFSGIIEERVLISRLSIRKRLEILQKKRKLRLLKATPDYVQEELDDIEEKYLVLIKESMHSIKFNAGISEGILLILGTLTWGFGDIVLTFII